MVTRWALLVEQNEGMTDNKAWVIRELERLDGTREQALARLEQRARNFVPDHPARAISTQLYRTAEGFLLVNEGSMRHYHCRFSAVEMLHDSRDAEREQARQAAAAREAKEAARRAEKAARKAARRKWGR
ncbi:hypothetical protein [Streptomyces sp. NPDC002851]